MIDIRKANHGDAEALWDIFREVVEPGTSFVADDSVSKDEVIDLWLSDGVMAYIACLHDEVVGAYMIKPNNPGRGSHIANATYMVKAARHGKGIGRKLGEHSLRTAKEMGFTAMQFNYVVSTNVAAVRLWESLGFSIIGQVPQGFQHPHSGLVDVYIMHRFL